MQPPRASCFLPVAGAAGIVAFTCLATMLYSFVFQTMLLFLVGFLMMPVPGMLLIGVVAHVPFLRTLAMIHTGAVLALFAVLAIFAAEERLEVIPLLLGGVLGPIFLLHYLRQRATHAEFLPPVEVAEDVELEPAEPGPSSTAIFRDPADRNP